MSLLTRIKAASAAFRGVDISVGQLDQIIDGLDIGHPTPSGVKVSEHSGSRLTTAYACINILSRDKSALPLKLYEKKTNGGRAEVSQHPVAEWVRRPNPIMTPTVYRRRGWVSSHTYGNDFSQIVRNDLGGIETWPLDARKMEVRVSGGVKSYWYTKPGDVRPTQLSAVGFYTTSATASTATPVFRPSSGTWTRSGWR